MFTYAFGVILPLTAIMFLTPRLSPSGRAQSRKQALAGTAFLAALFASAWACSLDAGGVESGQNGNWYGAHSLQPGAYRVPGGTIIPGTAQLPGCGGGGNGQYTCPLPIYIPDR
jgi:hypothetical protein